MTTYHYRIYTFQNGLGETVFRAKPIHRFLPQWATSWIEEVVFISGDGYHRFREWGSRDGVVKAVNNHAEERVSLARFAKQKTLKLIITEDESVEVSS